MPTVADLVYQKTTVVGTGPATLTAVKGFLGFDEAIPANDADNPFQYMIRHKTAVPTQFEAGFGYIDGDGKLVRARVVASSNSGNLVDFSAGNKVVINDTSANIQEKFFNMPKVEYAADHTLVIDDALKFLKGTKGTTQLITVPPHSDVPFLVGTQILLCQGGAGNLQLVAGSGVTITTAETLKLAKTNAVASLYQESLNVWRLFGNLEAAP